MLTADSGWSINELLVPFMSLFSVTTGIAIFTAGTAPTGSPVPLLSVAFIAAGVLFWFGSAVEIGA